MKYIKRFALTLTVLMLAFCFVGCGDSDSDTTSSTAASEAASATAVLASSSTEVKSSSSTKTKAYESPQSLLLLDTGISVSSSLSYSDTVYINYCGIIKNPNKYHAATFPKVYATVKDGSTVLTTDSQTGFYIMPGDTVALVGTLSVLKSEITSDTSVYYSVECSDFVDSTSSDMIKTSYFKVANVSEHSGSYSNTVTGEITNNSDRAVDMVCVSVIMMENADIVFCDSTFVDGISAGGTKAFELTSLRDFPEHDNVKVYVQEW